MFLTNEQKLNQSKINLINDPRWFTERCWHTKWRSLNINLSIWIPPCCNMFENAVGMFGKYRISIFKIADAASWVTIIFFSRGLRRLFSLVRDSIASTYGIKRTNSEWFWSWTSGTCVWCGCKWTINQQGLYLQPHDLPINDATCSEWLEEVCVWNHDSGHYF